MADWGQWEQVIFSLLSAVLGVFLFFLFQCRRAYLKERRKIESLITFLRNDLTAYANRMEAQGIPGPIRKPLSIWPILALPMIEQLPPGLVETVIAAYREIDAAPATPELADRYNLSEAIGNALTGLDEFEKGREFYIPNYIG